MAQVSAARSLEPNFNPARKITFGAAGTYTYADTLDPISTGTIKVPALASLDGAGCVGVASATCTDAEADNFVCGGSLSFGSSGCGATSATCVASATRDASLCAANAANRSLNIIEVVAATETAGAIALAASGYSANTLLMSVDGGMLRAIELDVRLTTGISYAALSTDG